MKKLVVLLMSLWCGTAMAANVNQLKINTVKQIYPSADLMKSVERFAAPPLKTLLNHLVKTPGSGSAYYLCRFYPIFHSNGVETVSLSPDGGVKVNFEEGGTVNVKLSCSGNKCLVDDIFQSGYDVGFKNKVQECIGEIQAKEAEFVVSAQDTLNTRDIKVMNIIMDMYNNRRFDDDEYLEAHSTPRLLKKLEEACPYGECYGGWEFFRTGAQDGISEESFVTHIQPLGNGWYEYHFLDMGLKGATKVKIIEKNGKLYFDDVQ